RSSATSGNSTKDWTKNRRGSQSMKSLRDRIGVFIATPQFRWTIIGLILLNAVTLGLQTSPAVLALHGAALSLLDNAVVGIFVVEIALRLYVHRLSFFRDGWSVFDFVIVCISLAPATGPLSVLRTLRVLRLLRL